MGGSSRKDHGGENSHHRDHEEEDGETPPDPTPLQRQHRRVENVGEEERHAEDEQYPTEPADHPHQRRHGYDRHRAQRPRRAAVGEKQVEEECGEKRRGERRAKGDPESGQDQAQHDQEGERDTRSGSLTVHAGDHAGRLSAVSTRAGLTGGPPVPTLPAMRFRTARQAEEYLLGFVNYEALASYRRTARTHDLRRFAARLADMGWDPTAVPTVHVGGTNAKGTVAHLIERILRAGGERTGLYTSPHLHTMRERVRVNGRPISAREFAETVSTIADHFSAEPAAGFRTTFEHLTALALLHFQKERVSRAVVEVGLGGRLDATNVLPPGPAVLTPISLDHRAVLGRTVGTIAADKAFILKRGGHAFVMPQSPTALSAIRSRLAAEAMGVTMVREAVQVVLGESRRRRGCFRPPRARGLRTHSYPTPGRPPGGQHRRRGRGGRGAPAGADPGARGAARAPRRMRAREAGGRPNRGAARCVRRGTQPRGGACGGGGGPASFSRRSGGDAGRDGDRQGPSSLLRRLWPVWPMYFVFTRAAGVRSAPPELLARRSGRAGRCTETVLRGLDRALALKVDVLLVAGSFLVVAEAREALGLASN